MSDRTKAARTHEPSSLPARSRSDLYDGVSTEMSDRRAISLFAMFALDEPEDRIGDEGVVAFLPEVCAPAFARR